MLSTIQLFKNQWFGIVSVLLLISFAASSCDTTNSDDDESTQVQYSGNLQPSSNDVTTSASGTATVTYNTETHSVSYEVTWDGLTSNVVGMHFHDNGPVIHGIEGWDASMSGSVSGSVTFSAVQGDHMEAGDVYVQIHTENYPPGEVIAILTR